MRPLGQSALDLLLGLLVLLVVLNLFSGVVTRYDEVQREMAIRQQLRENLNMISTFIDYGSGFYYNSQVYPKTNSLPESSYLYERHNFFLRSFGAASLSPVRGVGISSPFSCSFTMDTNIATSYGVYAYPAETGLPFVIDTNVFSIMKFGYDANHLISVAGCFDFITIEALP